MQAKEAARGGVPLSGVLPLVYRCSSHSRSRCLVSSSNNSSSSTDPRRPICGSKDDYPWQLSKIHYTLFRAVSFCLLEFNVQAKGS